MRPEDFYPRDFLFEGSGDGDSGSGDGDSGTFPRPHCLPTAFICGIMGVCRRK